MSVQKGVSVNVSLLN